MSSINVFCKKIKGQMPGMKRGRARRTFRRIFTLALVLLMLVTLIQPGPIQVSAAEPEYLTVGGVPNSVIILPYDASEKENYAAKELQDHIRLVSGADVSVLHGEPGELAVGASLSTTEISASQIGYYPFTVSISNPGNTDVNITLTAATTDENAPGVELKGQDGKGDGQLTIAANSCAIVSGLVTVDGATACGTHNVDINVSGDGEDIASLTLVVDYSETNSNLLQNPGIEDTDFTPWYETSNFYSSITDSHSGAKSIYLYGPDNTKSGYNLGLNLKSGYAYELKFWAKRDSGSSNIRSRIVELNSSSQTIRESLNETFELTEEWVQYSAVFYNNPGSVPNENYIRSWFNLYLAGEGAVMLDDFALNEIGQIGNYHTALVETNPPGSNIFLNPGVEEDTNRTWDIRTGLAYDTTDYHGGSRSITATGNSTIYIQYNNAIYLNSGYGYRLSFYAKQSQTSPSALSVRVRDYDTAAIEPRNVYQTVNISDEWAKYSVEFIANSNNKTGYKYSWLTLYLQPENTTGQIWADDFVLEEIAHIGEVGDIILPSPGEKPELAEPVSAALNADGIKVFLATPESYPGLRNQFASDLDYIGDSDGFAVRRDRDIVYIFGSNADGTLNGVYDFIESNLGVLWTRSIDLGTLYDQLPSIPLTRVNYNDKPAFQIRGWHLTGTGAGGEAHSDPATEILMSRNKLNAKFAEQGNSQYWDWQKSIGLEPVNLGHNLQYWLLQSQIYKALSEDDKAKCWNTDSVGNPQVGVSGGQLNIWNPVVAEAIAQSVNAFLDTHDIKYVGVGMEDSERCVQKPEDTLPFEYAPGQYVQPGDPKYLSTVFFSFINKVAQSVQEEHPGVMVTTYAYKFTETPPYGDVEDNVAIVIAPINADMKLPLTDPTSSYNVPVIENMEEWTGKTNNILVYDYYGCFTYASSDFERPIAPRIQSDLQYYVTKGFTGLLPEGRVDLQSSNVWALNALEFWLYSKLTWNPYADIQELTELFMNKAYGTAADAMLEYYDLLNETWQTHYTYLRWNAPLNTYIRTFYGDSAHNALMQAALDEAWAAAGETQKLRIAPIKEAFERNAGDHYVLTEEASAKKTNAGKDAVLAATDMSSSIWADAPVLEDFRNNADTLPISGISTKLRLLWDNDYLYVAYENFDNGISDMKKSGLTAKGSWWEGLSDDVETYLSKSNVREVAGETYRVYFTNPLGNNIVYESVGKTSHTWLSSPGDWYTATQIFDEAGTDNDRWVVIQAIPFEQLGITGTKTTDTEVYGYFYRCWFESDGAFSYKNMGWGASTVWEPESFRRITLLGAE